MECGPGDRGPCDEWRAMLVRGRGAPGGQAGAFDTLSTMSEVSSRPASAGSPVSRPSVIQLVFREKGALYAAYVPLLMDGGLFVPTAREYRLGEDIYLLLSLPDDPQRYPVAGKVAWITPANASGGRTQGVGVRFPNDEKTRVLKNKIEEMLGTTLQSAKPTQTI
jgi:type IV pilus assembly protein PilZ